MEREPALSEGRTRDRSRMGTCFCFLGSKLPPAFTDNRRRFDSRQRAKRRGKGWAADVEANDVRLRPSAIRRHGTKMTRNIAWICHHEFHRRTQTPRTVPSYRSPRCFPLISPRPSPHWKRRESSVRHREQSFCFPASARPRPAPSPLFEIPGCLRKRSRRAIRICSGVARGED